MAYKYQVACDGCAYDGNYEHGTDIPPQCPVCAGNLMLLSLEAPSSPFSKQEGGTHYKQFAIQPAEFIQRNKLNWYEGNVVKYITRHRYKNGKEDVLKAMHYLEMQLAEYEDKEL